MSNISAIGNENKLNENVKNFRLVAVSKSQIGKWSWGKAWKCICSFGTHVYNSVKKTIQKTFETLWDITKVATIAGPALLTKGGRKELTKSWKEAGYDIDGFAQGVKEGAIAPLSAYMETFINCYLSGMGPAFFAYLMSDAECETLGCQKQRAKCKESINKLCNKFCLTESKIKEYLNSSFESYYGYNVHEIAEDYANNFPIPEIDSASWFNSRLFLPDSVKVVNPVDGSVLGLTDRVDIFLSPYNGFLYCAYPQADNSLRYRVKPQDYFTTVYNGKRYPVYKSTDKYFFIYPNMDKEEGTIKNQITKLAEIKYIDESDIDYTGIWSVSDTYYTTETTPSNVFIRLTSQKAIDNGFESVESANCNSYNGYWFGPIIITNLTLEELRNKQDYKTDISKGYYDFVNLNNLTGNIDLSDINNPKVQTQFGNRKYQWYNAKLIKKDFVSTKEIIGITKKEYTDLKKFELDANNNLIACGVIFYPTKNNSWISDPKHGNFIFSETPTIKLSEGSTLYNNYVQKFNHSFDYLATNNINATVSGIGFIATVAVIGLYASIVCLSAWLANEVLKLLGVNDTWINETLVYIEKISGLIACICDVYVGIAALGGSVGLFGAANKALAAVKDTSSYIKAASLLGDLKSVSTALGVVEKIETKYNSTSANSTTTDTNIDYQTTIDNFINNVFGLQEGSTNAETIGLCIEKLESAKLGTTNEKEISELEDGITRLTHLKNNVETLTESDDIIDLAKILPDDFDYNQLLLQDYQLEDLSNGKLCSLKDITSNTTNDITVSTNDNGSTDIVTTTDTGKNITTTVSSDGTKTTIKTSTKSDSFYYLLAGAVIVGSIVYKNKKK